VSETTAGAHIGRKLLDVSGLPSFAFGHRDPLWWGLWMLIIIESMMFGLLGLSYFYLRGNYTLWPPPGAAQPPLWISGSTVLVLLASAVPMYVAFRAAWDGKLRQIRVGMVLVTALSILALVPRAFELATIGYNWNSHAYGSVVWGMYFMHTFHLLSGVAENAVFTALTFIGPVEKKHMLDVRLSSYYWWFVVASWVVLWIVVTFIR
jgi:cytochrome c oxidase subunit 3